MAASLVPYGARAANPVTLAEVKEYLRVTDTAQDNVLNRLILAGTDYAETCTGLQIRAQRFLLTLDHFPYGYSAFGGLSRCDASANVESPYYEGSNIILQRCPLYLATSGDDAVAVSYIDANGTTQSLTLTTDFLVDYLSKPGRIYLPYNETWPTTRAIQGAVTIYFTAGYNATQASEVGQNGLPDGIRQAITILVSHWYENRTPIIEGHIVADVPLSVESLLWSHRVVTL